MNTIANLDTSLKTHQNSKNKLMEIDFSAYVESSAKEAKVEKFEKMFDRKRQRNNRKTKQ